uniref:Uncharacterized protein n=1 Tax=Rhizophora mucronata TaxID=61149 RepID=A0A2P2PUL0_RHIMU
MTPRKHIYPDQRNEISSRKYRSYHRDQ